MTTVRTDLRKASWQSSLRWFASRDTRSSTRRRQKSLTMMSPGRCLVSPPLNPGTASQLSFSPSRTTPKIILKTTSCARLQGSTSGHQDLVPSRRQRVRHLHLDCQSIGRQDQRRRPVEEGGEDPSRNANSTPGGACRRLRDHVLGLLQLCRQDFEGPSFFTNTSTRQSCPVREGMRSSLLHDPLETLGPKGSTRSARADDELHALAE